MMGATGSCSRDPGLRGVLPGSRCSRACPGSFRRAPSATSSSAFSMSAPRSSSSPGGGRSRSATAGPPSPLQGRDPADWPQEFMAQFHAPSSLFPADPGHAKHKYVFNGFDFDELYDLEADPTRCGTSTSTPRTGTCSTTWSGGCGAGRWPWATRSRATGIRPRISFLKVRTAPPRRPGRRQPRERPAGRCGTGEGLHGRRTDIHQ